MAATIGFFDGVHQGHLFLVRQLREQAAARGLLSMVVTFDRHPRQVLHVDWQPQLLSTLGEKRLLLEQTGIDRLVVLPFTQQLASLTAYDFMRDVLRERLGVTLLQTGYDNHFGCRTSESREGYDDYVRYGQKLGIEVVCGEPLTIGGQAVSSSRIRRLLAEGCVEEAAVCLGRHYSLEGVVVHGEQVGREMGFPTANLLTTGKMIPRNGVYAVKVKVEGEENEHMGVTNIGLRPTFDGHRLTIETHILDFRQAIYDKTINIRFVARIRDEQHFSSREALARQMVDDVDTARKLIIPES